MCPWLVQRFWAIQPALFYVPSVFCFQMYMQFDWQPRNSAEEWTVSKGLLGQRHERTILYLGWLQLEQQPQRQLTYRVLTPRATTFSGGFMPMDEWAEKSTWGVGKGIARTAIKSMQLDTSGEGKVGPIGLYDIIEPLKRVVDGNQLRLEQSTT